MEKGRSRASHPPRVCASAPLPYLPQAIRADSIALITPAQRLALPDSHRIHAQSLRQSVGTSLLPVPSGKRAIWIPFLIAGPLCSASPTRSVIREDGYDVAMVS